MKTYLKANIHEGALQLEHGLRAKIECKLDSYRGPPWKECEGHGPVSDWTCRDKRPGERVLSSDRRSKRYYNFAEAVEVARRDGWGLSTEAFSELAEKLGRTPTKGDVCVAAVERDYELLKDWCEDHWHWIGVVVTLYDAEGNVIADDSRWGLDSADDYWKEVAADDLNELLRNWEEEQAEKHYWACRDTLTV